MGERIVITVDGLAGSGKTALSKALAKKLGWLHMSTGLLYRAVGYLALQENVDLEDGARLATMLEQHSIELKRSEAGSAELFIDGEIIGEQLHQPEVSEATSKSAKHAEVRSALVETQRRAFLGENLVAEGRDLGTVIYPEAELKFFVKASEDVRVKRRLEQLYGTCPKGAEKGSKALKKEIEMEISERDRRDAQRSVAPAVAAADALIIDNSAQALTSVVQNMYDSAASRGLVTEKDMA